MHARTLKIVWALMSTVVVVTFVRRGPDARALGVAVLYAAGCLLLPLALARDRGAAELWLFGRSMPARIGAAAALLLLTTIALAISVPGMLQAALVLGAGLLALWAARPEAAALTRVARRLLALTGALAVALVAAELAFRTPQIVARVGGGSPRQRQWEREHLDAVGLRSSFAFRSLHLERSKANGVVRILALGDSFTWGVNIARTEDVWPYVLERALQTSTRPIEVINTGIPTYTTVNEAEVLATKGWSFEPDIVVLEFTLNDPLPSGPHFVRETEEWLYQPVRSIVLDRLLRHRSFLYSFLDGRSQALQMRRHPRGLAPLFDEDFDGWHACRAAIREMAEASRQRHVPMILMLFPYFVPGKLDEVSYPYLEVHRKVMAAAEDAGIPALDLRQLFAATNRDGVSWWAFADDSHPNEEGQRLAGEALAAKLRQLNWIPSSGGDAQRDNPPQVPGAGPT